MSKQNSSNEQNVAYDFCPPPRPINFGHGSHMYHIDNIGHVATKPGSLAATLGPQGCPSRSAWHPISLS